MPRLLPALALLLALAAGGLAPALAAQEATPVAPAGGAPAVLPPDAPAYGAAYPEWVARYGQWFLSFPDEASPFLDEAGARCGYGQHGPVFFLEEGGPGTVRACTVPAGVALLVPVIGASCSTVEAPPFFGRDEAGLGACARALFDTSAELSLSVDGAAVPDLERFRVQSDPFAVALPAGNPLGVPPVVVEAVVGGYFVLLAPLPPGEHEVRFAAALPEVGVAGDATYALTVAEPVVLEPAAAATPAA